MPTQTTPNNADLFLDWLNFQKNESLPKLKSANGTSSTTIANVIKGWEKEYTWLAYDDENNAMLWQNIALFSFALRLRVVAVGKIPARLKSGERMRFATGKQD